MKKIKHLLPDFCLGSNYLGVAKFVEGKHGKPELLDKNGHSFYRNRTDGDKMYWLCRQYYNKSVKCSARAHTKGNNILNWIREHNH